MNDLSRQRGERKKGKEFEKIPAWQVFFLEFTRRTYLQTIVSVGARIRLLFSSYRHVISFSLMAESIAYTLEQPC